MANVKLAQVYKTSLTAVLEQFALDNDVKSDTINALLNLSAAEFQNMMLNPPIPLTAIIEQLSIYLMSHADWQSYSATDWYGTTGDSNFTISKASLFLRVSGVNSPAFILDDGIVVDLSNHYSLTNGVVFLNRDDDGTGGGSMIVVSPTGSTSVIASGDSPTITYPIQTLDDVLYNVWFRVRSTTSIAEFDVLIDGQVVIAVNSNVGTTNWTWVAASVCVPDRDIHMFSIRPRRAGQKFDKMVVYTGATTPSGTGPANSDSPFVTCHCQVYETDVDGVPTVPVNAYDYKNTLAEMLVDDWYNFDVDQAFGNLETPNDEYAVVFATSGGNEGQFVIWDLANATVGMPSFFHDGSVWTANPSINQALMIYTKRGTANAPCGIITRAAQELTLSVGEFDENRGVFNNTKLEDSPYAPEFGHVVLDQTPKNITIISDESGSMTWNDPQGFRHTLAKRLANRIDTGFLSSVTYNLLTFGSTPVTPVIFATDINFATGSAQQVAQEFFKKSPSNIGGIRVVRKVGSYPQTPIDGDFWDGIFSRFNDSGLETDVDYYYSVYTYNYASGASAPTAFSLANNIQITPRVKNTPRGISQLNTNVLRGTGVSVDSSIIGCWHLDEGTGENAFDFSPSNLLLAAESLNPRWLTQIDVPIGYSGVRFDGLTDFLSSSVSTDGSVDTLITVMAWVFWHGGNGCVVCRDTADASITNYAVLVNSDGTIRFQTNLAAFATSTNPISNNTWTHIAATCNITSGETKLYINGSLDSTQTISAATDSTTPMKIVIGARGDGSHKFFGRITEVSVHDTIRSGSYVLSSSTSNTSAIQDNGDRVVTFSWVSDALSNGTAYIVAGLGHSSPTGIFDGTVVYVEDITAGHHVAQHSSQFVAGRNYVYRIFVKNTDGNFSLYEDSAEGVATIPYVDTSIPLTPPSPALTPPSGFSVTPANGKCLLKWTNSPDYRVTGVAVYYAIDGYPLVTGASTSTGVLAFSGGNTDTENVFQIANNETYYFTLVGVNNVGQVTSALFASVIATETDDQSVLKGPPVIGLHFEPVNETSVDLIWTNPSSFTENFTGYYTPGVFVYAMLLDPFGNTVVVPGLTLSVSATVSVDQLNNILGSASTPDPNSLFTFTSNVSDDGLLRGGISFDMSAAAPTNMANIVFRVGMAATGFNTDGIMVRLNNPVTLTLTNVNADMVPQRIRNSDNTIRERMTEGTYARRNAPIVLRADVTYMGNPVGQMKLVTAQSSQAGVVVTVTPPQTTSVSGSNYNIAVPAPQVETSITYYASVNVNGFSRVVSKDLLFASPLIVELNPVVPVADGVNVAEQFCSVWLIDSNDPTIIHRVPDLTPVQWTLSVTNQPFYSQDNVRLPNGVFSYLRTGIARKVFFGPVSGIDPKLGRDFLLTASVVYDGLSTTDHANIHVLPRTFGGTVFLAEFDNILNQLWADGQDYVKMTIVHDPNVTTSTFGDCFLSCSTTFGNDIVALAAGQQITIKTLDAYDIITGTVVETTVGGNPALDTTNAQIATQTATITLSSDTTTLVYFRLNKTHLAAQSGVGTDSQCDCFQSNAAFPLTTTAVTLTGSMIVSGKVRAIRAGGNISTGMPPTVISPLEPLEFRVVDLRTNGFPSDVFVVDGTSDNEIVFEVSWRGGVVPASTPVTLQIASGGTGSLVLDATTIYTSNIIDPYLNPNGPERSFCTAKVLATNPAASFESSLVATVSYDKSGHVTRQQSVLVSISYVVGEVVSKASSAVFNGDAFLYTVGSDTWTTLASMTHPRGALAAAYANSHWYAIGGTNGRTVSQYNEAFNGTSWTTVADMPTPRAYAMTAVNGNLVYVIGGIAVDAIDRTLVVSQSIEVYNASSNTWTTLADMPSIDMGGDQPVPYGVAMGVAVYSGGNIFVLSGINQINNTSVVSYNDRVLRYNVSGNTWTQSSVLPDDVLEFYQRMSPFVVLSGTTVYVAGGVSYDLTQSFSQQIRSHHAETFSCDLSSTAAAAASSLTVSDSSFRNLPIGRYKGSSVKVGTKVFFLGGEEAEALNSPRVEVNNTSTTPFSYGTVTNMPLGLHSFGAATDGTNVVVFGGISSGRDATFTQISLSGASSMTLDGRNSLTAEIVLKDQNWHPQEPVNVLITTSTSNNAPVLTSSRITSVDGTKTVVFSPRSDDGASSIITMDVVIQDTTLVGHTAPPPVQTSPPAPVPNQNGVTFGTVVYLTGSLTPSGDNRGVFANLQQTSQSPFDLLPDIMPQGRSLAISVGASFSSVPVITKILSTSDSTTAELLSAVDALGDRIPFGASPMIDALSYATQLIQNANGENPNQAIYIFTDTSHNSNTISQENVIETLQAISGDEPVPVVFVNMSMQQPLLSPARSDSAEEPVMDAIAAATGGQTFSVLSENAADQAVTDITGRVMGAVGFGTFQYDVDLLEVAQVTGMSLSFTLPADSSATWKFSTSSDGYSFSPFSDLYLASETPTFTTLVTRVVRFLVSLSSGLTEFETVADETDAPSPSPSLDAINVTFNRHGEDFLFLNTRTLGGAMDDVVMAINADRPTTSNIDVGVSTWDNTNWDRFQTATQPAQDQNGKVVLPYRLYSPTGTAAQEQLDSVDGFLFTTRYGRWQPPSGVIVYDSTGAVVSDDTYNVYPDSGVVVFDHRRAGQHFISITDPSLCKVGIKITNRSVTDTALIRGVGVMYTQK